jgi:cbb3-type cytochrome oxidase subunit 1
VGLLIMVQLTLPQANLGEWLSFGRLHFWGWRLITMSAALTLPLGMTQSKECAELEWPIDIAMVAGTVESGTIPELDERPACCRAAEMGP